MNRVIETGDAELIRAINRSHILNTIRRFEPISRQEICRRTGLSRSTVSMAINTLLTGGLLLNNDLDEASTSTRGRPVSLLRLNPNAAYVVGMKLTIDEVSIVATNLCADPLAALTLPIRPWRLSPESIVNLLEDGMRSVLRQANLSLGQIAGVGVGLPGFIDSISGVSHWSPILLTEQAPVAFAQMLHERIGVPVTIENDANLLALAERWFGHGQDIDSFMVVSLEGGVGMGLFLNGQLYRGHSRMGTEFGHSKIERDGPLCRCSQRGCVEAFAADYAILREARKADSSLGESEDPESVKVHILEAVRRARAGDVKLQAVFANAGDALGFGIANFINVINPQKIIIAGAGAHAIDLMSAAILASIKKNTVAALANSYEIIFHDWPNEAWLRGAASLVLENIYRKPLS